MPTPHLHRAAMALLWLGLSVASLAGCGSEPAASGTADALSQDLVIRDAPGADVPSLDVPSVDVPSLDVPSLDVPSVDVPSVDVPSLDVPSVDVPEADTTPLDAMTSDTDEPDSSAPDASQQDADAPDTNQQDATTTPCSKGNWDPKVCGCAPAPTAAFNFQPGKTAFGTNAWIQYIPGELPIILSEPHGGYLKPATIKDRTWGIKGPDSYTLETTLLVAETLYRATGKWPHVILNRLHRSKLDANRDKTEAAQGDPNAEQAWAEFHAFIDAAKAEVTARCGRGLYIDMHANAHASKWTEFGYRLNAATLDGSDTSLNTAAVIALSSLRAMATAGPTKHATLLRGTGSLGDRLASAGYKSVPAPTIPSPGKADYFRGGYNTERHGSKNGGTIDGVQIETYTKFIAVKSSARTIYSRKLGKVLLDFVEQTYSYKLSATPLPKPAHGSCLGAKSVSWPMGAPAKGLSVSVADNTAGTNNEFGTQITCGQKFALDGPQLYYALTLQAGRRYRFTLQAEFPTRFYLFEDTCTPAAISASCKVSGLNGPLVKTHEQATVLVDIKKSGTWRVAVDSRDDAWFGPFNLTVTDLGKP